LFAPAVFGGRIFFERDILSFWYPQVTALVLTIGQGSWPLWNTYSGFGAPLLADPGSQIAYPTTWLNLVLLPTTVYTILVVLHTVGAGVGVFCLARHRGATSLAALVSGWTWCACGPFLSAANLYHHFCGAAWIPWVMLAADRLLEEPGKKTAAALGVTAAAQALAGSADMCLMSALAVAIETVAWIGRSYDGRSGVWARTRAVGLAILLAASLGAVQWVPTLSLLPSVGRARFQAADNLYWSVHPASLADAFVPGAAADLPFDSSSRARLFDDREPFLTSLYLGMGALAAVLFARGARARVCAVALALFLLLALGRYTPIGAVILTRFPFRLFRYPVKYMIPGALFWALLAGMGVDALRSGAGGRRRSLTVSGVVGLIAVAAALGGAYAQTRPASAGLAAGSLPQYAEWGGILLSRKLWTVASTAAAAAVLAALAAGGGQRRRAAAILLALVAGTDLFLNGRQVNRLGPPELATASSPALALLGPPSASGRVLSAEADLAWLNAHFTRGVPGWPREFSWMLGLEQRLSPPLPARWGYRGSYDADYTGLANPNLPLMSSAVLRSGPTAMRWRLLRLGNVSHVITVEYPFEGLPVVGEFSTVYDVPVRVVSVPGTLPPAFTVAGVRVASDAMAALRVVGTPDFDPAREVILGPGAVDVAAPPAFRSSTTLLLRKPDRIVVDVDANLPAYLVVTEAFETGWRATVDGRRAPVIPANVLFQAVAIGAGRHRVELAYRPPTVLAGGVLTLIGLAASATLLLPIRR
jgi:membrane protein YfhO